MTVSGIGKIILDALTILRAAAAITANGSSTALSNGPLGLTKIRVNISAKSGTSPTLDIKIEASDDNFSSDTENLGSFPQINGTSGPNGNGLGDYEAFFKIQKKYYRATWTVGGTTPSFTTAIYATSVDK